MTRKSRECSRDVNKSQSTEQRKPWYHPWIHIERALGEAWKCWNLWELRDISFHLLTEVVSTVDMTNLPEWAQKWIESECSLLINWWEPKWIILMCSPLTEDESRGCSRVILCVGRVCVDLKFQPGPTNFPPTTISLLSVPHPPPSDHHQFSSKFDQIESILIIMSTGMTPAVEQMKLGGSGGDPPKKPNDQGKKTPADKVSYLLPFFF